MSIVRQFESNLFALAILLIIYIKTTRLSGQVYPQKVVLTLIRVTALLICSDLGTWYFNGNADQMSYLLHQGFVLSEYILTPLPGGLWLLYADYHLFHDQKRLRNIGTIITAVMVVNGVLSIASLFNGTFFYIDSSNYYNRGPLFAFHVFLGYLLMLLAWGLIIANSKKLDKKLYQAMVLFPVPQVLVGGLQLLFYGLSLVWPGLVLSILIAYLYIQDAGLNTDYLTGAYNRRLLDIYLKDRIKNVRRDKSFSAIYLDMDHFKQINDTYGHPIGDKVLQEAVGILRSCLKNKGMITRLGGDEFLVLLDIDDPDNLYLMIQQIEAAIADFNRNTNNPYQVGFSMGYAVYDYSAHMQPEEFIKHLDTLMYTQKHGRLSAV